MPTSFISGNITTRISERCTSSCPSISWKRMKKQSKSLQTGELNESNFCSAAAGKRSSVTVKSINSVKTYQLLWKGYDKIYVLYSVNQNKSLWKYNSKIFFDSPSILPLSNVINKISNCKAIKNYSVLKFINLKLHNRQNLNIMLT